MNGASEVNFLATFSRDNSIKQRCICVIPARYQSTRLPGKPLLKINNKTIIQRTYEQGCWSRYLDSSNIVVATDDDRILDHIIQLGGQAKIISEECLNGTDRICHILPQVPSQRDIVLNIQGDEPFINPSHIDYVLQKHWQCQNEPKLACTTLHYPIKNTAELTNRNVGKMVLDQDGYVMYCSRAMIPHSKTGIPDPNRVYYGHIGIFVFQREFLTKWLETANTPNQLSEDIEWLKILEMGYRIRSWQVKGSVPGVNTPEDFNFLSKKHTEMA